MATSYRRKAFIAAMGLTALSLAGVVSPGISSATECGPGTVYEAATDRCVGLPPPPTAATGGSDPRLLGRNLRADSIRLAVHRHLTIGSTPLDPPAIMRRPIGAPQSNAVAGRRTAVNGVHDDRGFARQSARRLPVPSAALCGFDCTRRTPAERLLPLSGPSCLEWRRGYRANPSRDSRMIAHDVGATAAELTCQLFEWKRAGVSH